MLLFGNKPLPEPMLTQNYDTIWYRQFTKSKTVAVIYIFLVSDLFWSVIVETNVARWKISDASCIEDIFIAQTSYASDTHGA